MNGSTSQIHRRLLAWYDANRRELPWRLPKEGTSPHTSLDPYHVLVSEAMLQQTQVATVVPYFNRFIQRFPTIGALAAAQEQEVLRLWQGLGYYSRARNLHAAARKIVAELDGRLPRSVTNLLELPGIGRYTAGAISSIAFEQRAPILDGNVARVLCRLDKIDSDPRDKPTQTLLWQRAEAILPEKRCGDFNSALMELGATVCTPRNPQCLVCPVQKFCEAFAAGMQDRIPPPRKTKPTPLVERLTFCIARDGKWLIEQRPARGRWAGMWQFVTVAPEEPKLPLKTSKPRALGVVTHALTHRRYRFEAFVCEARGEASNGTARAWASFDELDRYPLPKPHLEIAGLLKARNLKHEARNKFK